MERLLAAKTRRGYGLLDCADYWQIPYPEWMKKMKSVRADLDSVPRDQKEEYAAADAKLALEIFVAQQKLADSEKELVEVECAAIAEYARMAATGVRINKEILDEKIAELEKIEKLLVSKLAQGGVVNPGSPLQRQKYLYEYHKIPVPVTGTSLIHANKVVSVFTEKGSLSTGADVIEALADQYPEIMPLAAWIDVDRMLSSLHNLRDHAELDGRIHALTTVGTETGRRSSSHPNLQNIKMRPKSPQDPAGDMAGILIAEPGACLIEIDYSNAENMTAAMQAADNNLALATRASDFHFLGHNYMNLK
jgi:DNA polymerase I-like protein with 3'-5' exonuclease and polymerase domains